MRFGHGCLSRWLLLATCALWPAFTLAGTTPESPSKPPSGKVFRLRLPFEPATLDWTLGDVPIWVIQNTMRGLYRVDALGKVAPDLVTESSQKDDGKIWTFRIQSGLKWSDGAPLTAAHCAEGLKRLLNPTVGSTYSYFLSGLLDENSIRAPSTDTLELRLKRPVPYLPAILSHWVTFPVRPDLIAQWKDYGTNPHHMAFLGPYEIADWVHTVRMILVPVPGEAGPKPGFQRVEAWIVPDDATSVHLFERDQLEFLSEPGEWVKTSQELVSRPSPILYFLGTSGTHPLTAKREGILALSAALNREEIASVLGVAHRPALGFCPPELWQILGKAPDDSLWTKIGSKGDVSEAKKWLKKAGYNSGSEVPPLTLRFFNRPAMKTLAEWLQGQWKKNLGIDVKLDSQDPKSYWSQLSKTPAALFLNSKGAAYPDPDAFFRLFWAGNPQNLGRWSDAKYDEWIEKAGQEDSPGIRSKLYTRASRRLLAEKPGLIPLYFRTTQYLMKPFVKGLIINPLTSVDFSHTAHYE